MSDDPVLASGERYWDEYSILMRYAVHSHSVEFDARDATKQPDGTMLFYPASGSTDETFETSTRQCVGYIKWDGCSHVTFGDRDGYLHLCGGRSFAGLVAVLREAFAIAAEQMPKFDAECADARLFLSTVGPLAAFRPSPSALATHDAAP